MKNKLNILVEVNSKTGELTATHKEFNRFNKTINKTDAYTGTLSNSVDKLANRLARMGHIAASAFIFDKITDGAGNVIDTFKSLEDASVGVQKTTGLIGKEFDKFTNKLDHMSTTMSGFEVENIYTIAEAAGQLGISGVNDLTKFTEAIAKVEITSDMTAQEAGKTFAKLTRILHEPIENIETLASVFNELSNNTSANVKDLSMFTLRIGGAGKLVKLTSAEILALGATLNDTGNNFEVGGSAINRLLLKMSADTKDFAEAMGADFEQFSYIMQNKPIKAIELFFEHMQKLNSSGQVEFLRKLQLDGVESASVLLKMAGATDTLSKNLRIANDEAKLGTSIQLEYATASQTLSLQQEKAYNELKLFAKALGTTLKPTLIEASALLGDMAHWGKENTDAIVETTKYLGKAALAYGVLKGGIVASNVAKEASFAIWGMYGRHVSKATVLVASNGTATLVATNHQKLFALATSRATIALKAFNIAFKANPLGFIATGAILAYEGIELLNGSLDKARKRSTTLNGLNERATELAKEYYELQDKINNGSWLFKQSNINELKKVEKEIATVSSSLDKMFTSSGDKLKKKIEDNSKIIKKSLTDISRKDIEIEDILDPKQEALIKRIADNHKTQQETEKAQWQKYYEEIGELDSAWDYKRKEILTEFSYLSQKEQEKIIALRKKEYFEVSKVANDEASEVISIMENLTSSMSETFENNFFDAITGKFTDFKSFLKTTFSDLGKDVLNPFASQLSSSFLGKSTTFATVSTGLLKDKGFNKDEKSGNWVGGTDNQIVVDSAGQVLQGASLISGNSSLSTTLNYTSGLKSAYGLATGGLSASIYGGFTSTSSALMSSGLINGSTAAGIDAFGFGVANPFTSFAGVESSAVVYGQALGGAVLGAAGGYIVGSLGDKLLGVDTKAGSYGAIGGAIGSLGGPIGIAIGSLLGSVIGGMFGKTKQVGSGFNLQSSASYGDVSDIQGYSSFEKNSWFNDESWTNVNALSSQEKSQINAVFGTYEYLLDTLTDNKDIVVQAGMYSGTALLDTALPKAFIQSFTGLSNIPTTVGDSELDKIFDYWNNFAQSAGKTVTVALTESVNSFITAQNGWERTNAQISGEDILDYDINVAKKQATDLTSIYGSTLPQIDGLQTALSNLDFKAFTELTNDLAKGNFTDANLKTITAIGDSYEKLALLQEERAKQLKQEEEQKSADLKAYSTAVSSNFSQILDPGTLFIDGNKWVDIATSASWAFKVGEDGIRSTAKSIQDTLINNPELDKSGDILKSTTTFLNAAISSLNNFKNALGSLSSSVQSSIDSLTSKTFKYSDVKNISSNLAHSSNETFLADASGMQNDIMKWYQGTTELKGIYDGLSANNKTYTKQDLDSQLAVIKSGKDIKKEITTFNTMLDSYKSTLDEQTNIVANIESVTNSLHDSVISMSLDDSISYLSHQDRASIALSEYKTAFTGLQSAMNSGNSDDTSLYLSRVTENSKAYLSNLKEYSGASKYQFEFARISAQLKGVNGLSKAQKTQEELTAETNRYMSDIQAAILSYDPTIAKSTEELASIAKDELLGLQNLINQKSFDPTINVSPVIYVNGVQTEATVQSNNVAILPTISSPYAGASYSDLVAGKTSDDLTPTFASQLRVAALAENNPSGYAIVEEWLSNEGFKSGGYTGFGNSNALAGSVHKDEYVINSRQLNDPINRDILERLEAQRKGQKSNSLNLGSSQKAQGLEEQNELLKEQNSMLKERNEMMYEVLKTNKEMLDLFEKWNVRGLLVKAAS